MSQLGIDVLLAAASNDGANIQSFPNCIAVFGGQLTRDAQLGTTPRPLSQRDAFVRWFKANRPALAGQLLLPENYDDWSEFNKYSDLLLFEEDLGYLTTAVVIFLEAPGAIAELGAFSQIESLRDQLVVVVLEDRHPKKSFISLGPLRQLEAKDPLSVCVIPDRDILDFDSDINVIISSVDAKMSGGRKPRQFVETGKQHQIILALDIVTILELATFTDIKAAYGYFGVVVNEARIHQILFALGKAGLIGVRRYGGTLYYFPVDRSKTWIDYRGVDSSKPFNRSRVSAKIAESRIEGSALAKAYALVFGEAGR